MYLRIRGVLEESLGQLRMTGTGQGEHRGEPGAAIIGRFA